MKKEVFYDIGSPFIYYSIDKNDKKIKLWKCHLLANNEIIGELYSTNKINLKKYQKQWLDSHTP